MLIPNQLIEVKMANSNIKHYKNLGYQVKINDIICVPPEHLTLGSHSKVMVVCDVCGKEYQKSYKQYIKQHTYDMDTCAKCKAAKSKQTCVNKYGVDNVFKVSEFKEKHKQTCLEKYGHEYISQVPEVREKVTNSFIEKYGVSNPMQSEELKIKQQQSLYENYNVYNPMKSKTIQEKAIATNIKKYGVKVAIQNKDIKHKAIETLCNNGTIPTSSQQLKTYNMIKNKYQNAELNYPFSNCSLDIYICINDIKIDVEYDGSYWHQDQQADIRRDKFLQSNGIKVLRIRSGHKIPTEKELFFAIEELITTDHMFKEIILSDWKQYKIDEEKEVSA